MKTQISLAIDSREVRKGKNELDHLQRSGQKAESAVGGLGRKLLALGAGAIAIRAVTKEFYSLNREGELLQRNLLRTEQLVTTTGKAAGFSAQQLHQQARALAAGTLESTEGIMGAQQILQTFKSVAGDAFIRTTELAVDLSKVTGQNLNSSMTQLGKVLEDPIRNLSALKRFGVSFTDSLPEMVKNLVETNRQAEAQSMILDVIAGQYGGVAKNEAQALAGAQDTMAQALQEARQAMFENADVAESLIEVYERLTGVFEEVTAIVGSGELNLYIERISFEFENLGKDIEYTLNIAGDMIRDFTGQVGDDSGSISDFLTGAFKDFAPNVRASIQLAAVYLADFAFRSFAYGKAIAKSLDPRAWFDGEGFGDLLAKELATADVAREESINSIMTERDAHISAGKKILAGREQLRATWEREQEALAANANIVDEAAVAMARLAAEEDNAAKKAAALGKAHEATAKALEDIKRSVDPTYAAMQDLWVIYDQLQAAMDAGLIDESEFNNLAGAITDKLLPALDNVNEKTVSIGENFGTAAGAAIDAMKIMQRGMDAESKHYEQLEVAIQATNVARAVAAVLTQGTGDPYTAFARIAAMAAVVASFGVQLSGSAAVGNVDKSAENQAAQGTGTILGDMEAKSESIANSIEITADATSALVGINRNMLTALQSMQAGITGAATMVARGGQPVGVDLTSLYKSSPLADAALFSGGFDFGQIGGGLGDFGIFDWTSKLLGGSASIRDQGIEILGGTISELIDDTMVRSFETVRSKKYAWSRKKTKTYYGAVSNEAEQQIGLVFDGIANSVGAGAEALGISGEEIEAAINNFVIGTTRISLKGLSADAQAKQLEAVFGAVFDNLTRAVVPWLVDFQKIGEGIGETLARVATNVQVMDEAVFRLGFQANKVSTQQFAEMSVALMDLAGGVEAFISGMSGFVSKFASEEHQFELLTADLTRALDRVGLSIPHTREAMWDLMQTLDASTESGREQIAALLELSTLSDEFYKELEKSISQALSTAEQALKNAFSAEKARLVDAYQESIEKLNGKVRAAATNIGILTGVIGEMSSASEQFTATTRGSILEAIMGVRGIAGQIGAGDLSGVNALGGFVRTLTEDTQHLYGNASDYARDQGKSALALAMLEEAAVGQLSLEELALEGLGRQIELAELAHSEQMSMLDAQLNALLGIDISVLSLAEAIANYQSAPEIATQLFADQANQAEERAARLAAEQAAAQAAQLAADQAAQQAADEAALRRSTVQYMPWSIAELGLAAFIGGLGGVLPSYDSGTSSVPTDMTANIHKGEKIIDPASSKILSQYGIKVSGGDNAELVSEIRQLKAYIRQTTKNTGETRDRLNRWNNEGLPEERVFV